MANAHALEEGCRPIVEDMINQGGAKAIAVASSYGDGSERYFLDSPKAEWLWEFAEANDIVVHIHPPMLSLGHEALMQYRLNEAVGRPFDSTVNGARMILRFVRSPPEAAGADRPYGWRTPVGPWTPRIQLAP
jgi:hypothetical protein